MDGCFRGNVAHVEQFAITVTTKEYSVQLSAVTVLYVTVSKTMFVQVERLGGLTALANTQQTKVQ